MKRGSRLGVVILVLLACNTGYFLIAGRLSEALDSLAWYVLLILFTLESASAQGRRGAKTLAMMRGARVMATLAIAASAVLYVREKEWLDASNLALWIAVVLLLEIEVRRPAVVAAHRKAFEFTAALFYSALGLLVLTWLARGEWMDAWDAALWLSAFGLLEVQFLSRLDAKQNIV